MTFEHGRALAEWRHDQQYRVGDVVLVYGHSYECVSDHKSKTFGGDLFDDRRWRRSSLSSKEAGREE